MNRSEHDHVQKMDSDAPSPGNASRVQLCGDDAHEGADLRAAASSLSSIADSSSRGSTNIAVEEDPLFLPPFHEISREEYYQERKRKRNERRGSGCTNATVPKQHPRRKLEDQIQHRRWSLGSPVEHTVTIPRNYHRLREPKDEAKPVGLSKMYQVDSSSKKVLPHHSPLSKGVKTRRNDYLPPAKSNASITASTPTKSSRTRQPSRERVFSLGYELPEDFTPRPWSVGSVGRNIRASSEPHGKQHAYYPKPVKLNAVTTSAPSMDSSSGTRKRPPGGRASSPEYDLPEAFTPRPWSVPVAGRNKSLHASHGRKGYPHAKPTAVITSSTPTSASTASSARKPPRGGASSLEYELPEDFTPRPWSVVVGRDKASLESYGNMRLRVVVSWYLERYEKSGDNKVDKTQIISEIESTIESANGGTQGAFIKFHNGRWWQVDPWTAREKIGRRLRESLHAKYSSSSRRKRERHRLRRAKVKESSARTPSSASV